MTTEKTRHIGWSLSQRERETVRQMLFGLIFMQFGCAQNSFWSCASTYFLFCMIATDRCQFATNTRPRCHLRSVGGLAALHTHTHIHKTCTEGNLPCCRRQQRPPLSWRGNQAATWILTDSSQRRTWLTLSLCTAMRSRTSRFSLKKNQLENYKSLSIQSENIRMIQNCS